MGNRLKETRTGSKVCGVGEVTGESAGSRATGANAGDLAHAARPGVPAAGSERLTVIRRSQVIRGEHGGCLRPRDCLVGFGSRRTGPEFGGHRTLRRRSMSEWLARARRSGGGAPALRKPPNLSVPHQGLPRSEVRPCHPAEKRQGHRHTRATQERATRQGFRGD